MEHVVKFNKRNLYHLLNLYVARNVTLKNCLNYIFNLFDMHFSDAMRRTSCAHCCAIMPIRFSSLCLTRSLRLCLVRECHIETVPIEQYSIAH